MNTLDIPQNHVLRIKRDGGKIELELMRFLSLQDMCARRPRKHQRKTLWRTAT